MKKILIGGVPHWEHDGVILPIMAGGDGGHPPALSPQHHQTLHGGRDGGGGAGNQAGDVRWVTNSVGLLEEQAWTGSRWVATGQVRNPLDAGGASGAAGRTQFESERALDLAQAERFRAQTENERRQLQADIDATEQRLREIVLQEEAADERQRLQLIAEREMLEMRLENSRRELAFSGIMAERQTLIQEKGAERARQTELAGQKPFKFAFSSRGFAEPEVTPFTEFRKAGQAFINEPLPEASLQMDSEKLEKILAAAQELEAPQAPFGFAEGGIIEMENNDGAFSMKPANEQTVLVGDGAGVVPGVTEALTVGVGEDGAFRVKVTPIAGSAQAGLDIKTLSGLADLPFLQAMRLSAGLPRLGRILTQRVLKNAPGVFSSLGVKRAGAQFGRGGPARVTSDILPPFQAAGRHRSIRGGLRDLGIPFGQAKKLARQFGPLPEPFKIAQFVDYNPQTGRMEGLSPTEEDLLLGLYELSGIGRADFISQVDAATIRGAFNRPQRIGFVGRAA
jgi:hypothetical protein